MKSLNLKLALPAALAAMMLSACGGGGGTGDGTVGTGTGTDTNTNTGNTSGGTTPVLVTEAYAAGNILESDVAAVAKALNTALSQHIIVDAKYANNASSSYYATSGLQTHYSETVNCAVDGSVSYDYSVSSQNLATSDQSRVYVNNEGVTAAYADCSSDGAWYYSGNKTTLVDSGSFSFSPNFRSTSTFVEIYNTLYLGTYAGDETYYTSGNVVTQFTSNGRKIMADGDTSLIQYSPLLATYYVNGIAYNQSVDGESIVVTLEDFNLDVAYDSDREGSNLVGSAMIGSNELGYAFDFGTIVSLRAQQQFMNTNYLTVLSSGTATATGADNSEIEFVFTSTGFTYSYLDAFGGQYSGTMNWADIYTGV